MNNIVHDAEQRKAEMQHQASQQLHEQQAISAAASLHQKEQEEQRRILEAQIRSQVEEEVRIAVEQETQRRLVIAMQTGIID